MAMLRIDPRTASFDEVAQIQVMPRTDNHTARRLWVVTDDASSQTHAEDAQNGEAMTAVSRAATSRPLFQPHPLQLSLKRALDVASALFLMPVYLPVLLVLAIAIKLDSPGPVFYNRVRVGKDGRPFVMYKLRTMVADAEQRLAGLQHLNAGGRPMI